MDEERLISAKHPAGHLVVALAYPQLCLFEFGIASELFGLARPELGVPWYDFSVVATDKSFTTAVGGLRVALETELDTLDGAGTIVIPGWTGPRFLPSRQLKAAMVEADRRGARFLSICSGAFLLGHCGLLDGRAAATHWRYESEFRELFPDVDLKTDELYVQSGNVLTSAGSSAGIDAGLHLIRSDYGTVVANRVAQRLVMQPHRAGGQRQFVAEPVPKRRHDLFDAVFDWARARLDKPISSKEMATAAAMSERNFHRRFRGALGTTPAAWLLAERIGMARALLEQGEASLDRVAERCGFASVETFRAAFRREMGVSASSYRLSFGAPAAERSTSSPK